MGFLLPKDYEPTIRHEIRQVLNNGDESIQETAERSVEDEIRAYLSDRYDVDAIFIDIMPHTTGASYSAGEYVHDNRFQVFKAIVADPGDDLSDTAKWSPGDPRNAAMVRKMIDMVVYEILAGAAPRTLSELRLKRYNDALAWFKMIMQGKLNPGLPVKEGEEGGVFRGGSNTKYSERW